MHVVLLAHEAGVLDGPAAGNRAVATTGGTRGHPEIRLSFYYAGFDVEPGLLSLISVQPAFKCEREKNYREGRLAKRKKKKNL